MNKLQVMAQKSIDMLLEMCVDDKPGITSEALWKIARDWDHKCHAWEFDAALATLRGKYRCTNKQWYPVGHVAEPKRKGVRASQTLARVRMDW